MARIRTYNLDTDVSANDYLLGNDGDSSSVITKRFSLQDLKDFFIQGVDINLINNIPGSEDNGGWLPSINIAGDDVEPSNVKTVFDRPASLVIDQQDLTDLGSTINIYPSNTVSGQITIEFKNFNFGIAYDRLVGANFVITQAGNSNDLIGTFGALIPFGETQYNVDNDGNEVWHVNGILDDPTTLDPNVVQASGIEFSTAVLGFYLKRTEIVGHTRVDDLEVGGDFTTTDLTVLGNQNFPNPETGITFADGIRMASDINGENLLVTGDHDVIYSTDVIIRDTNPSTGVGLTIDNEDPNDQSSITINHNSITIIGEDGMETPEIKAVQANEQTNIDGTPPTLRGTLSLIQIGDEYWSLAVEQSADAFILPGLHQDLVGSTTDTTTGTFFFGDDNGGFGGFQSELSITGTETAPALDVLTGEFTTETDVDTEREFLTRVSQTTPYSQRLFFIPNGTTLQTMDEDGAIDPTPVVGNNVVGPTYLVVSYIEVTESGTTTGTLTFSQLGTGNLIISAPTVSITSLPDAVDSTNPTLLFADDDGVLSKATVAAIAGQQAVVNYENTLTDTEGSFSGFTFNSGPNNHNITTANTGRVTLDLTGRFDVRIAELTAASDAGQRILDFWELITLGNLDPTDISITDDQRTLHLPEVELLRSVNEAGSTIKIVNASDVDVDGMAIASQAWMIAPAAGQRIMKLPADEPLVLNDPTSLELIWSGVPTTGWLISR